MLHQDANVGEYDREPRFITDADANRPQLFEMDKERTLFGDGSRLIIVHATLVGEEEDQILETENRWQSGRNEMTTGDNRTATITATTDGVS